jgi:hypothetical protein
MANETYFFMVWAERRADSIFGASSSPVMRNGAFLCFESEEKARAEAARLNGRAGDSHVHYSVKPTLIKMALPSAGTKAEAPKSDYAMPLSNAACTVRSGSF